MLAPTAALEAEIFPAMLNPPLPPPPPRLWAKMPCEFVLAVQMALALETTTAPPAGSWLRLTLDNGLPAAEGSEHPAGSQTSTAELDALFFATVQILTVSSQMKNPLTAAGRVVDVVLEAWALFVVTAVAGSFAAFFGASDP